MDTQLQFCPECRTTTTHAVTDRGTRCVKEHFVIRRVPVETVLPPRLLLEDGDARL
jgi:hypothetical protein